MLNTIELEFVLDDYPELEQAFEVWQKWCAGQAAPQWGNVKLIDMPPSIIPRITVSDVIRGGEDYWYRYWGTALVEIFHEELTNKFMSDVERVEMSSTTRIQLDKVVENSGPTLFKSVFRRPSGILAEKYTLRMPIYDKLGAMEKIISVFELKNVSMNPAEKLGSFANQI